jgi:non-homologous end joining protein Ku
MRARGSRSILKRVATEYAKNSYIIVADEELEAVEIESTYH